MKRKLFLILVLVFVTIMAVSSNADGVDIGPFIICDNDDVADGIFPMNAIDQVSIENGALNVVMFAAGTGDPNITFPLDTFMNGELDLNTYKAIAFRVKTQTTTADKGYIYFDTTDNAGLGEDKMIPMAYAESSDWQTLVFDLSGNAKATGTLTTLRLDPFAVCIDVPYEIKWIAFFKTAEDARNFNGDFTPVATPTPSPTPEPTPTPTPSPTREPTTVPTATKAPASSEGGNKTVIIAVAAALGVIAVVGIVAIVLKKKK